VLVEPFPSQNRTLSNPHLSLPDLPNSRAVLLFMPTRMVKLLVPGVVVQEILTLHACSAAYSSACLCACGVIRYYSVYINLNGEYSAPRFS
jgi:hypothetical protein